MRPTASRLVVLHSPDPRSCTQQTPPLQLEVAYRVAGEITSVAVALRQKRQALLRSTLLSAVAAVAVGPVF